MVCPVSASGRTATLLLLAGLITSVAAAFLQWGSAVGSYALVLAIVIGIVLAARPGLAFAINELRGIPTPPRSAALFSGVCMLLAAVWLTLGPGGPGGISLGGVLAVVGALVLIRASKRQATSQPPAGWAYGRSSFAGALSLALLAIVIPKFACGCGERRYQALLESDLRNLMTAQEAYLIDHGRFGRLQDLDAWFSMSSNDTILVLEADSAAWLAVGRNRNLPDVECGIWVGTRPPDGMHGAREGEPACWKTS